MEVATLPLRSTVSPFRWLGEGVETSWAVRGRSLGRSRTLDSHASRLRRKLNRAGNTAYVLNVWGVGYPLVATTR
jgi:DNA-binding response OmpR family regulator